MGIAHGYASAVILRAESPVYAGGVRQSNAFLGRTFSPQLIGGMRFLGRCPRLVSRRAVGPEEMLDAMGLNRFHLRSRSSLAGLSRGVEP